MAGRQPEESVRVAAACQRWRTMTFLHWSFDPEALQALLPDDLEIDIHEDKAWVGLTPFLMDDFSVGCLPPIPGLSTFPETNVRTYVRGPDGRDGLWFLSLEADSLPTVLGASLGYGVPYRWADMRVDAAQTVRYRSRRRLGSSAGHDITLRPEEPYGADEASHLDHWLTGRWRAYTKIAGRLAIVPVQHQPWPLWHAELEGLEQDLLEAAGVPAAEGEPLVHYSPEVDVRLGAPQLR
ncbi:MAG: DUF2071 domain-containing protein [Actinomycetota bacterium]|nr:DUF2071 domain-containing protein [Actinomycetota bacterium]